MIRATLDQEMAWMTTVEGTPANGTPLRLVGGPYDGQTTPFKRGLFIEMPDPEDEQKNVAYGFALDVEGEKPEWVGLWQEDI